MTLKHLIGQTQQTLSEKYSDSEARWMIRIIIEEIKGYSQVDIITKADREVSDFVASKVADVVSRLMNDEPLQYILGSARFYGLKFAVAPGVLIPRPETEQLVDLAVAEAAGRSDLKIADLCTGSGCIAIALARTLKFPKIVALDNSPQALAIAQANVGHLKVARYVDVDYADVLQLDGGETPARFDMVVSNPPYIAERESASMERNVLDYEPHTALFVPDSDPLLFYRAIAAYAMKALKPDGALMVEINPLFDTELRDWLVAEGWEQVAIIADIHGRNRFITARRP